MFHLLRQDRLFGVLILLLSCVLLFGWIPNDIESGVLDKIRRRWVIGDAMMPTITAYVMLMAGLWLIIKPKPANDDAIAAAHYIWMPMLFIACSLLIMRWLGPLSADLLGLEYRQIRTQIPWVYLGYVFGGGSMIFVLSCWEEGRWTWRRLAISLVIALVIALVLDLPLEDIQLPPNGDVG